MVKVIKYNSLEACMAAFWDEDPAEVLKGKCTWTEGDRVHTWPMRRFARSCRKRGVWGWCQKKKIIHAWVADHADPVSVLGFLAHEIGHMQRQFKRSFVQEEFKAEQYASVAKTAFKIMEEHFNGI